MYISIILLLVKSCKMIYLGNVFNFSDLSVPLWQWILSQAFALFALASIVYAMNAGTKGRTLVAVAVFNAFMSVSAGLLNNWVMMGVTAIAAVRDLVYYWRERKYPSNRILSYSTLILFLIGVPITAIFTVNWGADAFVLVPNIMLQVAVL